MPIIKSAIKRAKQTIKRRERNVGIKREIKTAVNAFLANPTAKGLSAAQSELDTAVKKGLLKKNTVARRMTRLAGVAKKAGLGKAEATVAPKAAKVAKTTVKKTAAKKPAVKKAVAKKTTK